MLRFIVRRLLVTVPMVLVVVSLTWGLIRLAPGKLLHRRASDCRRPSSTTSARSTGSTSRGTCSTASMLGNTVRGDFGSRCGTRASRSTTILANAAAGVGAARRPGLSAGAHRRHHLGHDSPRCRQNSRLDYASMAAALVGISLPNFVLGPAAGAAGCAHLVLAAAGALGRLQRQPDPAGADAVGRLHGLHRAADAGRHARSAAVELHPHRARQRAVRARGRDPPRLRGGLLPVVSFSGPALALLVTGTVVVERIFALPGLGNYFINANLNRDEPLIIGIVAFISIVDPVFNLLVDIAYALRRSAGPLLTVAA